MNFKRSCSVFGGAISLIAISLLGVAQAAESEALADDGKLRIIVFGAHPDDSEIRAAGCAVMWVAQGHHVKFVSTTNGDIGHAKNSRYSRR